MFNNNLADLNAEMRLNELYKNLARTTHKKYLTFIAALNSMLVIHLDNTPKIDEDIAKQILADKNKIAFLLDCLMSIVTDFVSKKIDQTDYNDTLLKVNTVFFALALIDGRSHNPQLPKKEIANAVVKSMRHAKDIKAFVMTACVYAQIALQPDETISALTLPIASQFENDHTSQKILFKVFETISASGIERVYENGEKTTGYTLVHMATAFNLSEVLNFLINTPDVLKLSITATDNDLNTPMHIAASEGHDDVYVILIKAINNQSNDPNASENKGLIPLLIAKNNDNSTPAHLAACNGKNELLEALILAGVPMDIGNKDGDYPSHLAAHNGHTETLMLLHKHKCLFVWHENNIKNIPLHLAASNGHTGATRYLTSLDKNTIEHKNAEGNTPAHLAAHSGRIVVLHELFNSNTLNLRNNNGDHVTHLAVLNNQVNVLRCLYELKTDYDLNAQMEINLLNEQKKRGEFTSVDDERLKTLKAELNAPFDRRNADNMTAQEVALLVGSIDAMKYLISLVIADEQKSTSSSLATAILSEDEIEISKLMLDPSDRQTDERHNPALLTNPVPRGILLNGKGLIKTHASRVLHNATQYIHDDEQYNVTADAVKMVSPSVYSGLMLTQANGYIEGAKYYKQKLEKQATPTDSNGEHITYAYVLANLSLARNILKRLSLYAPVIQLACLEVALYLAEVSFTLHTNANASKKAMIKFKEFDDEAMSIWRRFQPKYYNQLFLTDKIAQGFFKVSSIWWHLGENKTAIERKKLALTVSENYSNFYIRKALERQKRKNAHCDLVNVAAYLCNIGLMYADMDKIDESIEYKERGLAMLLRINLPILLRLNESNLSNDNYHKYQKRIAMAQGNLAVSFQVGFERLIQLNVDLLSNLNQDQLISIDENQERILTAQNNLALDYTAKDMHEEAVFMHRNALHVLRKIYGNKDHEKIANSLQCLGVALDLLQHRDEAVCLFKEALEMNHRLYTEINHDTAMSHGNLGIALSNFPEYLNEAKEHLEAGLRMLRHMLARVPSAELRRDITSLERGLNNVLRLMESSPLELSDTLLNFTTQSQYLI